MPPPPAISSVHGNLILEEPLIRTPYELLRRSHRSAQRQVEKDFLAVQTALNGVLKSLGGAASRDEARDAALGKLDQVGDRFKGLKRKAGPLLDDLQPSTSSPTPLRSRMTYLEQLVNDSKAPSGSSSAQKKKSTASGSAQVDDFEVKKERDVKPSVGDDADVEMGDAAVPEPAGSMSPGAIKVEAGGEVRMITPPPETSEPPTEETDKTIDRYIVDYLLRTGRMRTAKELVEAQGVDPLVDVKLFAELGKIETALMEKHSVAEALAWCGENRGTLKKTQNNLEFTLRMQEFTELCRKRETAAAITYSRKNLAPWASTHMPQLQQAMTMLLFGERTGVNLYKQLYNPARWATVRDAFRETFLGLYALPTQPLLSLALSAGLSSLRLPTCTGTPTVEEPGTPPMRPFDPRRQTYVPGLVGMPFPVFNPALEYGADYVLVPAANPQAPPPVPHRGTYAEVNVPLPEIYGDVPAVNSPSRSRAEPPANVDCPTCGEHMRVLAKEVPMSHHVNSTLVCRISGEVMDSLNEPLAFPNGYVYSTKALTEMAKNNFDVVTCPRTGESCAFSRLRKVYIS